MKSPAPTDLDEVLSPPWLSEALSSPARPVTIKSVRTVDYQKNSATKVRFEVDYESAPSDMHRAFCVKGFFGDSFQMGGYASRAEARYYLDFAPDTKVRVPICTYAAIDEKTGHGMIVMQDVVAAGGRFLGALQPYTPDQAAASLDQLALLHAEHWLGKGLDPYPWLTNRLNNIADGPWIPMERLQTLMDGERSIPLDPAICSAQRLHKGLMVLLERMRGLPQCLVHGDAHAGNVFEMSGKPSLIDWQMLQLSSWALDAPYHIATTLTVEDREKSEKALLKHYLDRLRAYGVEPPSWDDAWAAYRTHMLYGYFMWSITQRVDPPIILEFVKRLGSAVSALETFELLGV